MKRSTKGKIVKTSAVIIDVAGPVFATLSKFPVWIEKSPKATVSGLALVLIAISCIPFIRQLKAFFKSPSVLSVWLIMFIALIVLNNIIEDMMYVAFVGLISGAAGTGIYKLGDIIDSKGNDNKGDET